METKFPSLRHVAPIFLDLRHRSAQWLHLPPVAREARRRSPPNSCHCNSFSPAHPAIITHSHVCVEEVFALGFLMMMMHGWVGPSQRPQHCPSILAFIVQLIRLRSGQLPSGVSPGPMTHRVTLGGFSCSHNSPFIHSISGIAADCLYGAYVVISRHKCWLLSM